MKFKIKEEMIQDPFFMLIIHLEKEEKIELGPFSNEEGYKLKRYLRLLDEMSKQDSSEEYEYITYFYKLLHEKWKLDEYNHYKSFKMKNFQVYYHDETGKVIPVEILMEESDNYYYICRDYVSGLYLSLFKGDVVVTDQPISEEKQKELNVFYFENPKNFLKKYNYQEKFEIDINFPNHLKDNVYVIKTLDANDMEDDVYKHFLKDLELFFELKDGLFK